MHPLLLMAAAGAALGAFDKNLAGNLPRVPGLGQHGTIALAAYAMGGGPLVATIAKGAALLAGYEYMTQGHVNGDDDWFERGF